VKHDDRIAAAGPGDHNEQIKMPSSAPPP